MMCCINLRTKPQRWKLMIPSKPQRQQTIRFRSYLSRLFISLAVSTWTSGLGIICLDGGMSVTLILDLFPFVHPREYWKVWAFISMAQNAMITRIKSLCIFHKNFLNNFTLLSCWKISIDSTTNPSLSRNEIHCSNDQITSSLHALYLR